MSAQNLIVELQAKGVRFELRDDSFRVLAPRGLITLELRDELTERKPEILALLKLTDAAIEVSHIVGDCPHCTQPLLVYTHPLDAEVWIQCQTKPELFKALKHEAREWCRDCGDKLTVIAGRCAECIQRLMLASDKPCTNCNGFRFWRHLAGQEQPAGFLWHCSNCEEPTGKVAIHELTERGADA
jgi:ssDNA-binding Zn-finger/Zn-ribbon topoisomerase 1